MGFLGPNGARKTTALKILPGLLYPSKGQVMVGGHIPHQHDFESLRMITLFMG